MQRLLMIMAWQIILMLKQKDPSAPFTFNEIAQLPKEIHLPKHSTKTVECQLTLPEKPFNGYVLGGLYFEQKSDEQPAHSENGVAINNRFSYVVGVLLSETDEPVQPELSLNEVKPIKLTVVTAY